jgi:hypothetical protein
MQDNTSGTEFSEPQFPHLTWSEWLPKPLDLASWVCRALHPMPQSNSNIMLALKGISHWSRQREGQNQKSINC